jgi:hypothetical protein
MVGREREVAILREELSTAIERSCPRLVTVLGAAGVGKSRLVAEALERRSGLNVAYGRCLSYGDGATYWPLAEVIRSISGITELETPEQCEHGLRRLLTASPTPQPLATVSPRCSASRAPEHTSRKPAGRSAGCSSRWHEPDRLSWSSMTSTGHSPASST